ncbi:MAG TPA: amidohydrolase family protein [Jatrophihabitantaceae bacterium]|nr:amidohydrolase family protein [Jatrophihabitantaceae bacterium]
MRTLYRNGRILVPAGRGSVGRDTAMLVEGSDIAWVGDERDAAQVSHEAHVDLGGALVTPAFVDAHVHLTSTGLALTGLDLGSAGSVRELLDHVEALARTSRGRPIIGGGWDERAWPEQRPPTRAELDRAAYGGAVYLARVDVHSAVVSSALLAATEGAAGLTGFRPDGWLTRDAHDAARRAAYAGLTRGQRLDAQRGALRHAAELGIACVHEMAGPSISSATDLADLLELSRAEALPEVLGYWGELFGADTAVALGAIGAGGDLFCDGSLGSHTAALHRPYHDHSESSGALRYDTADLSEHLRQCARHGVQAGFHAIGDAAVDQVLDAIDAVSPELRPFTRIEHAEMVAAPARVADSGAVASMQPVFDSTWGGSRGMYAQRLGAERAASLNDFAALAAAGVTLAFGSDAPVTPMSPWTAVQAAVHPHRATSGITPEAAFQAHTSGGWAAAGRPGNGRIELGAPATFAVWLTPGETADLPDLTPGAPLPTCVRTVRAGTTIHEAA